ncbi:ATP-dependent DNA ligase [Micromonospora sp. BRA006-A]|nr:ATP-dependent DNA ligase [Micromonospora sp. BRA006-A]
MRGRRRADRDPADGPGGQPRLDFELLAQRIHPAASRVKLLAETTPADFVAFDLLAIDDELLVDQPYPQRRERLEQALSGVRPPARDPGDHRPGDGPPLVRRVRGRRAGRADRQPADLPYEPGKRLMSKVKHARTMDAVVAGFRWHKSGPVVGSLLLGLYDDDGVLHHIGVSSSFTMARRKELLDELEPYRDVGGEHPWVHGDHERGQRIPGGVSRWTGGKNLEWEPLRPALVVEVAYDAMEGDRLRHTARFVRWRPDRDPRSCDYGQLDRPIRYDVDEVLRGDPAATVGDTRGRA